MEKSLASVFRHRHLLGLLISRALAGRILQIGAGPTAGGPRWEAQSLAPWLSIRAEGKLLFTLSI